MFKFLTDEEYNEELAKRGLKSKKTVIDCVYYYVKKPQTVEIVVDADEGEKKREKKREKEMSYTHKFRFLSDEEYNEELTRRGLKEKKVKMKISYYDGRKRCQEEREIYRFVEADSDGQ